MKLTVNAVTCRYFMNFNKEIPVVNIQGKCKQHVGRFGSELRGSNVRTVSWKEKIEILSHSGRTRKKEEQQEDFR